MKLLRTPLFWFFIVVIIVDVFIYLFIAKKSVEIPADFPSEESVPIEEDTEIKDAYYWEFIAKKSNPEKKLARGEWNVLLNGDFLPQDSINLQQLLTEINDLTESISFRYTQDSGKYNIGLTIFRKSGFNNSRHTFYLQRANKKYDGSHLNAINLDYIISDDLTQEQRNNVMKFYLVHAMIDFYELSSKNTEIILPRKHAHSSKTIDPATYSFPENDRKFLSLLYTKHFHFELFKSSPFHLFTYLQRIHKEKYGIFVRIIVYLFIIGYFIIAYRFKYLVYKGSGSKVFQRNAVTIATGFGLLVLLIQLAYSKTTTNWSIIIVYVLNVMLIALLIIQVVKFAERKLIKGAYNDFRKIVIQVVISTAILFLATRLSFWQSRILGDVLLFFVVIITARAMIYLQRLRIKHAVQEKELQLANLQKLQHQTELQAIHSRINPHFLYNSLNSIASLARSSPENAEEMALSLSDFFRYSINKKNEKMISLKDELDSVKTYLKIEKIRFSDRLEYTVQCEAHLLDHKIPRFVLQPLVENAIKHGVSELVGKGIIRLEIERQKGQIIIRVADNGKDFPTEPTEGFGLQSLYDKLELIYKGQAKINWTNKPDKAIIISLPFDS